MMNLEQINKLLQAGLNSEILKINFKMLNEAEREKFMDFLKSEYHLIVDPGYIPTPSN